ncbi:hypothetical protein AB6A40_009805 [Gnathostoma spinigerum]|uniref:Uncharacterized protein n=1 Tax=Gnathostoma spinigerum TaxID=75299 RepID=A0ABD6EZU8_9BILA
MDELANIIVSDTVIRNPVSESGRKFYTLSGGHMLSDVLKPPVIKLIQIYFRSTLLPYTVCARVSLCVISVAMSPTFEISKLLRKFVVSRVSYYNGVRS